MTDRSELKTELRAAIDNANDDGTYSEQAIDKVHELVNTLVGGTPMPRPIDEQEKVASPWGSLFAQFGPKHTVGKPIVHETNFKLLTFNNFPDKPMRLLHIEQEIHHDSKDYNNVQIVESLDGNVKAHLIVYGRYEIEEENPKRYMVDFYKVALKGANGETGEELRNAFDFDDDQALEIGFKPPALHSDVVYCDDELRINFGSIGGVYVMERNHHDGYSVSYA